MPTEKIDEYIEVIAHFDGKTIKPLRFKWNDQAYKVKKILFKWDFPQGQYKLYRFRVLADNSDIFEIVLFSETMKWKIETVDVGG